MLSLLSLQSCHLRTFYGKDNLAQAENHEKAYLWNYEIQNGWGKGHPGGEARCVLELGLVNFDEYKRCMEESGLTFCEKWRVSKNKNDQFAF